MEIRMPRSILLRLCLCAALLPLAGCEWLTGDDRETAPRFASVATGAVHSCALTVDGEAYCWGSNGSGQLGLGTTDSVPVTRPGPVTGGLRFRSLHAGGVSTCGVDVNDGLHCWGQLRAGPAGQPTALFPETRFASVSPHLYNHACGVTTARTVGCWGTNESGVNVVGPGVAPAPGATDFARVSAGAYQMGLGGSRGFSYPGHVCGVKGTGAAYCWGDNTFGQLGIASDARQTSVPTPVAGGLSFRDVRAGLVSTCGLDANGALYCWGRELARAPQRLGASLQFAGLDMGARHGCAVTAAGQAYCWGRNTHGQLGTGTTAPSAEPQRVHGDVPLMSVSASAYSENEMFEALQAHTCGVSTDHRVYCWGSNEYGQLGNRSRSGSLVPVPVADPARGS
jgi:alpha-tubulin suppressor-like RCC1 family protein